MGLARDAAGIVSFDGDLGTVFETTPPPEPDHAQVVVRYVPASQAAQVGGD